MSENFDPLVLDLVEWVAREPRAYSDVLDIWRTSCPRLTIWEDAIDRGLLSREFTADRQTMVIVTAQGKNFLAQHGRIVTA